MNPFKGYQKKLDEIAKATIEVQARRQVDADKLLSQQIDILDALKPAPQTAAPRPTPTVAAPRPNYLPYVAAAAGVVALLILIRNGR